MSVKLVNGEKERKEGKQGSSRGPDPRSLAWPAPIPHRVGRVWPRETKTRESLSRETNGGGREMSLLLYS